jgi:hypothetical protein
VLAVEVEVEQDLLSVPAAEVESVLLVWLELQQELVVLEKGHLREPPVEPLVHQERQRSITLRQTLTVTARLVGPVPPPVVQAAAAAAAALLVGSEVFLHFIHKTTATGLMVLSLMAVVEQAEQPVQQ